MNKNVQRQLEKLKADKKKLALLILSLISIILWTGLSIFSSQKSADLDKELVELSRPLVPYLEREVLTRLEEKRSYSDNLLNNFQIYRLRESEEGGLVLEIIDDSSVVMVATEGGLLE